MVSEPLLESLLVASGVGLNSPVSVRGREDWADLESEPEPELYGFLVTQITSLGSNSAKKELMGIAGFLEITMPAWRRLRYFAWGSLVVAGADRHEVGYVASAPMGQPISVGKLLLVTELRDLPAVRTQRKSPDCCLETLSTGGDRNQSSSVAWM